MNPEEHERMYSLCQQIAVEKDPTIFDGLVRELNELLEVKQFRIRDLWLKDPFVTKLK